MRDIFWFVVIVILSIAITLGMTAGLISFVEYRTCETLTQHDESHRYLWTFWTACRVQTSEGYWVHYSDAGILHLTSEEGK